MRFPKLYDDCWLATRQNLKKHKPLSDERLWHRVYERYIDLVYEHHPATLEAISGLKKTERRDVRLRLILASCAPLLAR